MRDENVTIPLEQLLFNPSKENTILETLPFELFFLGELRAEGIIDEELFSHAMKHLKIEKDNEIEVEL